MILCFRKLLLLLAHMLIVSTDQCKFGIFHINPNRFDTKLDRYRIRTFENISPRACFDNCIRRPRCHSYNYNRHVLSCELNYQPTYVSLFSDFLSEIGFIYVEVDHYRGDPLYDTCLGNPCLPGEICERTDDGDVFCINEHEEIGEEDCTNLKKINPKNESGVYTIYPFKTGEGIQVFCDMTNGGWTVIQRRIDGRENFQRNWIDYENGFGDLQNEFWLGNEYINFLTSKGSFKLRVELVHSNGTNYYAEYSTFFVGDASLKYRLTVHGYSGNAGNWMDFNSGKYFSTYDREYACSCASTYNGWWHSCCSYIYLNDDFSDQLKWGSSTYYHKSQMMIQRTT